MPQDPSSMAGMPAFMNQPQYQQQMQGLAMQVRQQEEGTKKIKKFLKAYEDIQLSAPMAPQQPGFMGGGMQQQPQQPMMQPPGGGVRAGNNNLPRNDMSEPAPESFTAMAGGSIPSEGEDNMVSDSGIPAEPTYETANIGEEEGLGGTEPYGPNRDAKGNPYTSPTMTNTAGLSMNTKWTPEEKAQMESDKAAAAEYRKRMGLDKQDRRNAVEGRDKRLDKVPLEQRGDKEAMDPDRQYQRKRSDNTSRWLGQSSATLKEHNKRDGLRDVLKGLKETIKKVTDSVDQTFRPNTYHYDGKTWVINEKGPDWDSESGKKAKVEIGKINTSIKKIEQQIEGSKKKQDKISSSKPNKVLGLAGMAVGSMAAAKAGAASLFPPQDPDLFLGSISATKEFEKLRPDQKAMVQKFLEYKAESDSLAPSTRPPRGKGGYTDEPIELTSYDKLLRGQ